MNVKDIRFRASKWGDCMTEPRGEGITKLQLQTIDELVIKARTPKGLTANQGAELERLIAKRDKPPTLSDTCTAYLVEVYLLYRYGRKREFTSRAIEKGLKVEEDSITLWSRIKGTPFFKNTQRFTDQYFTGCPDENHPSRPDVKDTKSSWDLFTFSNTIGADLNKKYEYQGRVYMRLTGKDIFNLAYCLVDTPDVMVQDAKRRLSYQMGLISQDSPDQDYIDACAEIDRLSRYDDIPMAERINEITITRDKEIEDAMVKRAIQCQDWLAATYPDFFDVSKDNQHPASRIEGWDN